jgi:hypothetical protein
VKVPKALMPVPCHIISACGKAKRLRHMYMKHIKVVASLVHLGDKAVASVLDAQHTINLHP